MTYKTLWPVGYLSRPEPASHLLLITVKWDRTVQGPDSPDYNKREEELKGGVWKGAGDGGAKICRFSDTKDSAWNAINTLLKLPPLEIKVLQKEFDKIQGRHPAESSTPKPRKGLFARLFSLSFFSNVRPSFVTMVNRLTGSLPQSS